MRRRDKTPAAPDDAGQPPVDLLIYRERSRGPATSETVTAFLEERANWRRQHGLLGPLMVRDYARAIGWAGDSIPAHLTEAEQLERRSDATPGDVIRRNSDRISAASKEPHA